MGGGAGLRAGLEAQPAQERRAVPLHRHPGALPAARPPRGGRPDLAPLRGGDPPVVGGFHGSGIVQPGRRVPAVNMGWRGDNLLRWQREKQGTVEQAHGVLKGDLGGGTMPCGLFGANAAWWRLNVLAANPLLYDSSELESYSRVDESSQSTCCSSSGCGRCRPSCAASGPRGYGSGCSTSPGCWAPTRAGWSCASRAPTRGPPSWVRRGRRCWRCTDRPGRNRRWPASQRTILHGRSRRRGERCAPDPPERAPAAPDRARQRAAAPSSPPVGLSGGPPAASGGHGGKPPDDLALAGRLDARKAASYCCAGPESVARLPGPW